MDFLYHQYPLFCIVPCFHKWIRGCRIMSLIPLKSTRLIIFLSGMYSNIAPCLKQGVLEGVMTKCVVHHQIFYVLQCNKFFFRFFGSLYHFFPYFFRMFLVVLGIGSFHVSASVYIVLVFSSLLSCRAEGVCHGSSRPLISG